MTSCMNPVGYEFERICSDPSRRYAPSNNNRVGRIYEAAGNGRELRDLSDGR